MPADLIKGVIFDLGSTLIEYENRSWIEIAYDGQKLAYEHMSHLNHSLPDFESFNQRLEDIKIKYRERAVSSLAEWNAADAAIDLFRELEIENPEIEGKNFIDTFYSKVREQISLVEGARETLAGVKRLGYKTGLISNTIFAGHLHDGDIEHFKIGEYLDFRIYSCEFGKRKPHPNIFMAGLEKIGLKPKETIYVGDRFKEDIEGPRSIGMGAVLKSREGREYPNPWPDDIPVVKSLIELLDLLKN